MYTFHLPTFPSCLPKAAGVAEYYEIMYKHWEGPLKALQQQRREKAKLKGIKEAEVIPDDDDDGDLELLESISLQQARRGIVVEGVIVIDDGGVVGGKLGEEPPKNTEDMKPEGSHNPLGGVEVCQTPPTARTRSPHTLNIDHVLNPPGLPHLGPYDLPGAPNALRAPSQTVNACEARIQALQ